MTPPNGNVSAPINTSATTQYKEGILGVGGLLKGYGDIQAVTQVEAPQYCIGASCITSWPAGGATPPAGSEFLDTSATAQTKAGGLTVGSATSTKDIVVNGVTFGRGSGAGSYYTQQNTATGYQSLYKNYTGSNNTANGYKALYSNTNGTQNTANGVQALYSNTTGYRNTANGEGALYSNINGIYNTAVGENALYNSTGSNNTANGAYALLRNYAGYNNTASGYSALYGSYPAGAGIDNTAVGAYSLFSNAGQRNTAVGEYALYKNTFGETNTAVGSYALYANTIGFPNTAIGDAALSNNTIGASNTALGAQSLLANITGNGNTAVGYGANVSVDALSNATAIGLTAQVTASNSVRIGNASVTQIGGQVAWSNLSDKRTKEDIVEYSHGLDFITKLRPVTFKFKADATKVTHSGFIAQEVEATNIPFYGLNKPANKDDFYSLSYSEFVVPLVNSVKELKAENDRLKADSNDLRVRLERLEAKIK